MKRVRVVARTSRAMLPALGLVLAIGATGVAQEAGPGTLQAGPVLSESARISLVTILPGKKVYSLFGHNALRVFDPERGIDIAYNYGTFEFGNPLVFSARFAYGDLYYSVTRQSYDRMVAYYPAEEGRPVIEQHLDLDPGQREEIFRFLEWNARPENAYYRYDFYYDNCATRLRDVLEQALGDRLVVGSPDPGVTMRQLLDPYLVERAWLHFGMDVGQGLPADAGATWRTELFLPDRLASWAEAARVEGETGTRPLVAHTDSIGWTAERVALEPARNWPFLALAALLVLVAWITILDLRSGRRGRAWLDLPFFGLLGLAGLLVVFLWFISLHAVTKRNLNLMWALPTHLVLAWALTRGRRSGWVGQLLWATAVASLLFVLGWPLWTQEVPLATLPLAAAVALRSAGLAFARRRFEATP